MIQAVPDFNEALDYATRVAEVYASIDARLQVLGRPSKFAGRRE
jgi:hypothetical protein